MSGAELVSNLPLSMVGNMSVDVLSSAPDYWSEARQAFYALISALVAAGAGAWSATRFATNEKRQRKIEIANSLIGSLANILVEIRAYKKELEKHRNKLNELEHIIGREIEVKHPGLDLSGLQSHAEGAGILGRVIALRIMFVLNNMRKLKLSIDDAFLAQSVSDFDEVFVGASELIMRADAEISELVNELSDVDLIEKKYSNMPIVTSNGANASQEGV